MCVTVDRIAAVALAVVAWLVPGAALAEGDAVNGKKLAQTHCQRCHVVSPENRYAGIESTPSFMMLSSRGDWSERYSTFFDRPPHPVFARVPGVPRRTNIPSHVVEFEVSLEEIEDLLAYARTLRKE